MGLGMPVTGTGAVRRLAYCCADGHGDDQQRQLEWGQPALQRQHEGGVISSAMPAMPNMLPAGAVSCRDSPARARMQQQRGDDVSRAGGGLARLWCHLRRNMASTAVGQGAKAQDVLVASRTPAGPHERDREGGLQIGQPSLAVTLVATAGGSAGHHQRLRRFRGDPPHAGHVPTELTP